jgi:hypothetical protein
MEVEDDDKEDYLSRSPPPVGTCEFCGGALRPCTDGPGYECETCGNFLPYDADGEPICLGCSKGGCHGHTCSDEVNHG